MTEIFKKRAKFRKRMQQKFDKENIKLKRNGETYNVYDHIQAAAEDTEIYPVLEKYGCIDKITLDAESVYADLSKAKDLKTSLDEAREVEKIFYDLPLETRKRFNNNILDFANNGLEYVGGIVKKERAEAEARRKAEAEANKKIEVTTPTIQGVK